MPTSLNMFYKVQYGVILTVSGASVTYEDGFVGVIRGFMVNGVMLDLTREALRGLYGISPGEVAKCASNPCLNNGTCIEKYSHFECDCAYTAFRGPICTDGEIFY